MIADRRADSRVRPDREDGRGPFRTGHRRLPADASRARHDRSRAGRGGRLQRPVWSTCASASTWTTTCPDHTGPYVLLLTDSGVPAKRALGYEADQLVRWDILDVNGETVIIERAASSYGGKFDEAAAAAQPIIDSIRFTPSNCDRGPPDPGAASYPRTMTESLPVDPSLVEEAASLDEAAARARHAELVEQVRRANRLLLRGRRAGARRRRVRRPVPRARRPRDGVPGAASPRTRRPSAWAARRPAAASPRSATGTRCSASRTRSATTSCARSTPASARASGCRRRRSRPRA